MKNILTLYIFLVLLSCNDAEKNGDESPLISEKQLSYAAGSFLDSIDNKHDLSFQQIAHYTTIDSAYWTYYPQSSFRGDTVWKLQNGMRAAIIDYSDNLVCSHTFVAVFLPESLRSTDVKIIRNACDRDLSAWYETLEYTRPHGSAFETIEQHYPPEEEEDKYDKDSIITHKWFINGRGKIDTLR